MDIDLMDDAADGSSRKGGLYIIITRDDEDGRIQINAWRGVKHLPRLGAQPDIDALGSEHGVLASISGATDAEAYQIGDALREWLAAEQSEGASFQKCQAGSAFNYYCGEMAETIVELAGSKVRLSVCPGCAGDLVENRGAIELECEDGMDGELHAVDHVQSDDEAANDAERAAEDAQEREDAEGYEVGDDEVQPEGRCQGGCSFWDCARKAGHPGPCQPDYEEQDRKAALTSAVVCIAAFVAGGIR